MDWRAIRRSDHQRAELGGIGALRIGIDRQLLGLVLQRAHRRLAVGGGNRVGDAFDADIARLQFCRIDLDTHRIGLRAVYRHFRDAGQRRKGRGEHVFGDLVHLTRRHRVAANRKQQNRRIGRVRLPIARRRRHVVGELAGRLADRSLHVGGSGVDIAIQVELQHDRRIAERVRGADFTDAGNGLEFLDQRRRDRRCHGLRRSTGQLGGNVDGREIDLRKGCDRQKLITGKARKNGADRKQRRCDGAANAECRDHCASPTSIEPSALF